MVQLDLEITPLLIATIPDSIASARAQCAGEVWREDITNKTEIGVISHLDTFFICIKDNDRCDWAKDFMKQDWVVLFNDQNRCWIEGAIAFWLNSTDLNLAPAATD
jgi:hypothetical protein